MSYFEWDIIHISKFKPGTVEKNSSAIGPPAGIEPTTLSSVDIHHFRPVDFAPWPPKREGLNCLNPTKRDRV